MHSRRISRIRMEISKNWLVKRKYGFKNAVFCISSAPWNPSLSSTRRILRSHRDFELYLSDFASWLIKRGREHGARAYARRFRWFSDVFSVKKKKEKEKKKKKVNDSLLCSTSFIRLDYIEHHPVVRGRFPYTLSLFFFLYSSLPPSSFPRFFPLFFLPFFPAGQLLYTSLDACTHLHTAISLYRAYANVYAFQHARTRAYN